MKRISNRYRTIWIGENHLPCRCLKIWAITDYRESCLWHYCRKLLEKLDRENNLEQLALGVDVRSTRADLQEFDHVFRTTAKTWFGGYHLSDHSRSRT